MKPYTTDIIRFNSLLHALGITDLKRELILQYTSGRTAHTKEMKRTELQNLVVDLMKQQQQQQQASQKIRKKILHYCHLMLWYVDGTDKLDYARIDNFCRVYGYAHKNLNKYTSNELQKLLWQFEQVYISYQRKK